MNRNICSVTSSDSGIIINSSGNTHTSSPLKIASASIAAIIANGSAIAQVKSSSELNMSNGDIVSSAIKTNGISHSTSNNNSIVNPDITLTLGSGLNVQNPNLHQLHQLHHHHQQPQQNHHLQQLAQLQHHPHHQHNHNLSSVHNLTLSAIIDQSTSDDSGRASERLTTSSVAQRDPDSSRDRLSDASSRCSSGKGYICDSEGEDDKGSDAGSVVFTSIPKHTQQKTTPSNATETTSRKIDYSPTEIPFNNQPLDAIASPIPTGVNEMVSITSPGLISLPASDQPSYTTTQLQVSNGSLVAHLSSVVGSQHAATTSQIQHQHQASIIAVQQLPSQSSVFPLTASINNKSPLSTTSAKLQPAEVLLLSTTVSDPTVVTTTVTSEKQQAIQHQLSLVSNSSQSASQLLITSSLADSNLMPPTPISVQPSAKQQQKHLLIRHQHQQHANDDLSGSLISVTSSHDSSHKSVFLNISAGSNGLCSSKTHLPPLSVVTNHSNSLGTNNKDEPSNSHHQQANVSLNENISSNIDVISGTNNGKSMNSNGNGKFSSLSVPSSHNSPPLKLAEPTGKNEIDLPLHVTTSALTSSTTVVTEAISTAGNMPCNIQSAMLHSGTLNTLTASTVPSVNVNNGSYTTPVVAAVTAAAHPSMIMTNGLSTLSPHFRAYPGYPLYSPYGNFPHNPYLPSSVTSPNLSPRLHPALTPIPHTLMGLGLMDARFPASLIAGSANNSSGSGRKSNDRDLSPLVQQQSSAAIATTVSSIANHQKVLPVTLNTISCSSNISLSLTCTSTTKGITSSNIGGTSGTSNSLLVRTTIGSEIVTTAQQTTHSSHRDETHASVNKAPSVLPIVSTHGSGNGVQQPPPPPSSSPPSPPPPPPPSTSPPILPAAYHHLVSTHSSTTSAGSDRASLLVGHHHHSLVVSGLSPTSSLISCGSTVPSSYSHLPGLPSSSKSPSLSTQHAQGSSNSGAIESGSISEQSLPQPSITTSINSNVGGGGNIIVSVRSQSPRGHSPNREKEGYSNIASSLSRSTPGPTILSSSGGGLAVAGSSTSIGSCTGAGPLGINPALSTTSAIVGGVVTYMPCLNVVSAAISTVSSSLTHPRTSLAIGGSIMSSSPAPSSSSSVGGVVVASEWLPNVVSNSQPTVTISSSSATVTTSIHNNSSSSASGAKTQQQHHHHTRPTPPPSSCSGFSSATDLSPASIPAYSASIPMSTTVSLSTPANTILYTPSVATPVVGGTQTLSITQPHPFSAESLFSTKVSEQADLLRRELDNRFLDRSGLTAVSTGPSYLRQELHHHQHQHTHLHQHQSLITGPTVGTPALFPPPLFKDVPKIGAVDSPFYRTGLGIASYPGYPPSLLHPGLSGPTQFVPTSHLQSFVPKQQTPPIDPNKKKTGKWNAMHVRIAWEIYHHQAKQNPDKAASIKAASDMLRPPSHMYPTTSSNAGNHGRVHDMPSSTFPPVGLPGRPGPYESNPLPPSFMSSPASHIGVSPFARYTSYAGSPFSSLSPFSRDIPIGSQISGSLHDPWRSALSRTVGSYSSGSQPTTGSWAPIKQDPNMVAESVRRDAEERDRQREREERERDRQRREREEREKQREREREEKLRKEQQERDRERERERERERKEKERRDMERREMERERLLHQQHRESKAAAVAAANAAVPVSRDRSPQRNGIDLDVRIKEEPRKDDEILLRSHVAAAAAAASDPRYHTSMMPHPYIASRHPASHMLPGSHLSRSMLPPSIGLPTHFSPHGSWGPDPFREYRLDPLHHPLRYNPLIDAYRAEEAKASLIYAAQTAAHFRGKGSSPVPPAQQQLPTSHLRLSSGIPSGGGSNACIPSGPNSGAPNATISVHSGTSMKAPLSTSTLSGSGTVGISSLNGNGGSGVGSAQTSPATLPSSVSSLSVELHKKDDICQIR